MVVFSANYQTQPWIRRRDSQILKIPARFPPFGHTKKSLGMQEFWILLRKEVIQPQIPLRLPCYDLMLIAGSRLVRLAAGFSEPQLFPFDGRCVQDPRTYSRPYS